MIQLSNIARVSTGSHCSYAVSNDNDIFGWGMNECYMMCNGLEDNIEEPKQLNSAKKFE